MNDYDWKHEIQWDDLKSPLENLEGEELYTLTMSDFLQMPEVDFAKLMKIDPQLKALLN